MKKKQIKELLEKLSHDSCIQLLENDIVYNEEYDILSINIFKFRIDIGTTITGHLKKNKHFVSLVIPPYAINQTIEYFPLLKRFVKGALCHTSRSEDGRSIYSIRVLDLEYENLINVLNNIVGFIFNTQVMVYREVIWDIGLAEIVRRNNIEEFTVTYDNENNVMDIKTLDKRVIWTSGPVSKIYRSTSGEWSFETNRGRKIYNLEIK